MIIYPILYPVIECDFENPLTIISCFSNFSQYSANEVYSSKTIEAYISSLKRYISLSFNKSAIFSISSFGKVVPEGLFGLVKIISLVFGVICFSSISAVSLNSFSLKSMYLGSPPVNFINEPYPT